MQKRVLETLNQFEEDQFFSLFEAEEESDDKVEESDDKVEESDDKDSSNKPTFEKGKKPDFGKKEVSEDGEGSSDEPGSGKKQKEDSAAHSSNEIEKEAKSIIGRMHKNFKQFLLHQKENQDEDVLTPFLRDLKKLNSGNGSQYNMFNNPYSIRTDDGLLRVLKGNKAIWEEEVSDNVKKEFSAFLSSVIQQAGIVLKTAQSNQRKARLADFLKESMSVDQYLNIYYDGVMEALENMGYTNEEADFIMGEAHTTGIAEDLATQRIGAEEAAKSLAAKAIHGLQENEKSKSKGKKAINEGLDPAIITYLIGTIGVFASAGLISKFQAALAKNKSPKVQAFAKALSKLGSSASSGIKGGTTSLGESAINEDAGAIMAIIPYVAGTLGTFIAAYGIDAIQKGLAKSKNKKLRAFGAHLAKAGSTASKSIIGGTTSSLGESVKQPINEGLDPAIITYLIGTIGVFASAGLMAKFQASLAKNKNPKVQAFAKALSKLGSSASSGIKGGTTSLGEGLLVKEKLEDSSVVNEDAGAIAALIPYIAGTLGTFIAAYGIDAIQKGLAKSKNKKLRAFGAHLAKAGSTASNSIIGGKTSSLGESVKLNEGLDPQILTYLVGIIGVFASAGLLGKLQAYLGKHKNAKVQSFAKMLSKVGSSASSGIKGGTTSLGESAINEDAGAIMAILPHVAGVLAIFLTAFGIEPLKKAMKNSKNKKLRNLASGLEKAGSAATGSREKVNL